MKEDARTTDDLRTALTKFADEWAASSCSGLVEDLRSLLAAHPAPEARVPAPVSDTRREDVARVEVVREVERHVIDPDTEDCSCGATRLGFVGFPTHAEHLADAVLAVLPAPPVVDEVRTLIEAHIAKFEASIARLEASIQDPVNTHGGRLHDTAKLHGQRGAVYALRRLADEIAARLRGTTHD